MDAAFEAIADPRERLAQRRGHEPEVVAASARLLLHGHARGSGRGGEGDGVVPRSTIRPAPPEPAGQVGVGRGRQQLSGIVGGVPVLRPAEQGLHGVVMTTDGRMGVAGEIDEGGVLVVVAQGEGQRAGPALGVAGDPPAAAVCIHVEVGSQVGGNVDGQIRLGVAPGTVDALGVTEGRAVGVDHQQEGRLASVVGGEAVGRPVEPGRAGPVRGPTRGAADELHHRPAAIGFGQVRRRQPQACSPGVEPRHRAGNGEVDEQTVREISGAGPSEHGGEVSGIDQRVAVVVAQHRSDRRPVLVVLVDHQDRRQQTEGQADEGRGPGERTQGRPAGERQGRTDEGQQRDDVEPSGDVGGHQAAAVHHQRQRHWCRPRSTPPRAPRGPASPEPSTASATSTTARSDTTIVAAGHPSRENPSIDQDATPPQPHANGHHPNFVLAREMRGRPSTSRARTRAAGRGGGSRPGPWRAR